MFELQAKRFPDIATIKNIISPEDFVSLLWEKPSVFPYEENLMPVIEEKLTKDEQVKLDWDCVGIFSEMIIDRMNKQLCDQIGDRVDCFVITNAAKYGIFSFSHYKESVTLGCCSNACSCKCPVYEERVYGDNLKS